MHSCVPWGGSGLEGGLGLRGGTELEGGCTPASPAGSGPEGGPGLRERGALPCSVGVRA